MAVMKLTPPARPSTPSMRLTALVMAMIQTTVKITESASGEVSSEDHLDADARAHQQQGGDQLHQQAEDGRQAELVVDEAGHDHERAAQQDGEHSAPARPR